MFGICKDLKYVIFVDINIYNIDIDNFNIKFII